MARPRTGDVLKIPLNFDNFSVAVVLTISRVFKGAMLIAVLDKLYSDSEAPILEELSPSIAIPINYGSTSLVSSGQCQVIGNLPELASKFDIPHLQVGDLIYYGDQKIGEISSSSIVPSHRITCYGNFSLVNRLLRHFRL